MFFKQPDPQVERAHSLASLVLHPDVQSKYSQIKAAMPVRGMWLPAVRSVQHRTGAVARDAGVNGAGSDHMAFG